MGADDIGGPSTSRRDLLKFAGYGGAATVLSGCNDLTDGGNGDRTSGGGGPSIYAVDPSGVVEGASDEVRAVFLDARYAAEDTPVEGSEATTHVVSYGHAPGEREDDVTAGGAPWLTTGVVTTPETVPGGGGENPLATLPLPELLTADPGRLFLRAIGVGDDVELTDRPVPVDSREVTALDQQVEMRAYLLRYAVPDAVGSGAGRLPGFGPGVVMVHVARLVVGGDAVMYGMVDGPRRPPTATPERFPELDEDTREFLSEAYREAVRAELFARSMGALGKLGLSPDELPPPPERKKVDESLGSSPVGMTDQGQIDLGYPTEDADDLSNESMYIEGRTDYTLGHGWDEDSYERGTKYVLDIETKTRLYTVDGDEPYSFGIVTSPRVERHGVERNRLVETDLEDLLTGVFDAVLVEAFDQLELYQDGTSWDWTDGPHERETGTERVPVGSVADTAVFGGTIAHPWRDDAPSRDVEIHVGRMITSDEVVFGLLANVTTGSTYWDDHSNASWVFARALDRLAFGPSTPTPWEDLTVEDLRLVQTVANTRVEDPAGNVSHEVDDPDLVAAENAAPVFGLSSTGSLSAAKPMHAIVETDVENRSGRLRSKLSGTDLADLGAPSNDPAAVLHEFAGGRRSENDPVVFDLATDHDSVTVSARAPSGYRYDSDTITEGTDYEVTTVDPLRVGFISVTDPEHGGNYGDSNGRATNYQRTVDVSLQYLHRTYPGPLYAYRHDTDIAGHRKGLFGRGEFLDFGDAQSDLEAAANASSFPSGGEVWGFGASAAAAENAISGSGFDAWVLVVPNGYWDHHGQDVDGLAPGRADRAVGTVEQGFGETDQWIAHVVAQEVGHHFVEKPYEIAGPNGNYPLGQRDDENTDKEITGNLVGDVDTDHARHQESSLDDSTSGKDDPGVVSEAFDLTDGTFTLVEFFTINRNSLSPRDSVGTSAGSLESFMSYSGARTWTDAVIHGELVDSGWSGAPLVGPIFSGTGRVEDDDTVSFASMRTLERGKALTEDTDDGDVLVEMVAPDGEVLASRRVTDSSEGHHGDDEYEGIVSFQFEFPAATATLRVTHGVESTTETTTNPVVSVLRDAVDRIPDEGYVVAPADSRGTLQAELDEVAAAMDDGEYSAANDRLAEFDERASTMVRDDYGALANQPTRTALLELSGRMAARIETLTEYSVDG